MQAISEYLLSVTGAAVISAIVLRFLNGQGSAVAIGRMICALFVALTAIGPVINVQLTNVDDLIPDVSSEAKGVIEEGEIAAKNALVEGISSRVETYILDKANQLGVLVTVSVELSEDQIPVPVRVHINGNISPYLKSKLQNIIWEDLGIDKENQIWT